MSASIPRPEQPPESPSNGAHLLIARIHTVQSVSETASRQTAQLLAHASQLSDSLDRLSEQITSLPKPDQTGRLAKQLDSLQRVLDWLATRESVAAESRASGNADGPDLPRLQRRLSMSRVAVVNLESAIAEGSEAERSLCAMRDDMAGLAGDLAIVASANEKAAALACAAGALAEEIARAPEPSSHLDNSGGEVLPGNQAEDAGGST
jgi:hypothetical protein